jgi:trans-2,3-dihydro-3-hydroxyanthranilate isomerase
MAHRFYIVDVFAGRPYAGNPLALVVGADDLSDEAMQPLAPKTNHPDSTIVGSAPEHAAA